MTVITAALAVVTLAALLYARRVRPDAVAAHEVSARYEALAAYLPDVSVLVYDAELRFTTLEGRRIADVLPAEEADGFPAHCRAALAGESSTHDWTSIRDGVRQYRVVHAPLRDARGTVVGGLAVTRDVTAPESLRRELEAQRSFLAGVLEQLTDQIVACDADGRLQVFGGVADDTVGPLDWPEFFGLRTAHGHTRLAAADVPLFRALQGEMVEGVEMTRELPGGALAHVVGSARPVRDADGRTIGAVATRIDITDRRATEARLRASEERYRSVVEAVEDIVFQTDLSGRWSFLNESWARWSGIPVAQGLGRLAHELVHPEDRAAHACAFAPLVAGEVDSVHLRHRYLTAAGVTRSPRSAPRWRATRQSARTASRA
jgi:PAS domain S-box-containing protein